MCCSEAHRAIPIARRGNLSYSKSDLGSSRGSVRGKLWTALVDGERTTPVVIATASGLVEGERTAPVVIATASGLVEVTPEERQQLIDQLEEPFASSVAVALAELLEAASPSEPVELGDGEKADLVETLTFLVEELGRDRVPDGLAQLRSALLNDLQASV